MSTTIKGSLRVEAGSVRLSGVDVEGDIHVTAQDHAISRVTLPGHWEVGFFVDGAWEFEGTYNDPQQATTTLVFATGRTLLSNLEDNGTFRVIDADTGELIACIRQVRLVPSTEPGEKPAGTPGPLKRYRGLTWVGWVNFLLLRWFLFRIFYVVETDSNTISKYGVKFVPSWKW